MRALAILVVCSCSVSVPLDGKECAASAPLCLDGYQCVAGLCVKGVADGGGGSDAGCPPEPDLAASGCPGNTYYLSPAGSDLEDGGTPSTARRSLSGVMLTRGDVVHLLGGVYAMPISFGTGSGNATCPLLIRGETDGGTVLAGTASFQNSHTVVRHLTFTARDAYGVRIGPADHLTLQYVKFALPEPTMGSEIAIDRADLCTDCTIRESTFANGDGIAFMSNGGAVPGFRLLGNRFLLRHGEGFRLEGAGIVVSGNDLTGEYSLDNGVFNADADVLITRNVFHDIHSQFPEKPLCVGGRFSHNTFAGITGNDTGTLLRDVSRFDSNLVVDADRILSTSAPAAGDFNIFDPTVSAPYADGGAPMGTDRVADVRFDGLTWVPAAGSAAIDSANPAAPVPEGGGPRADVGALERGATQRADGRYCYPDGGVR